MRRIFYDIAWKRKVLCINISKCINASLLDVKFYQKIYNNKSVKPLEAKINLIFKLENGEISKLVVLDESAKTDIKAFYVALGKGNNPLIAKFNETSFYMFRELINQQTSANVLSFVNAGRRNYENFQGRLAKNAYMENGKIFPANEYGEVKIGKDFIKLDNSHLAILPQIYTGSYDIKSELYKLLSQTEEIYKGRIEPFLCLGTVVLCMFLEEIWNERAGFPVLYQ